MTGASPYRARDIRAFVGCGFLSTAAMQVQSVAIGWQIYDIERTPLALGLVGLCQFVPMFLLTLPAGELADRVDPRRLLAVTEVVQAVCSGLFLLCSLVSPHHALPFYIVLALFGASRGFSEPAGQSLLPFLVPPEGLAKAIARNSSLLTVAVIAGPALGGFLFAAGPLATYSVCLAAFLLAAVLAASLGGRRVDHSQTKFADRWERVIEGVHFVRTRPIVLGAISLDLFAVLLGGAVALLPVFARDVLHVGPLGLGVLRSAPAAGAALMAFTLARYPIERRPTPHAPRRAGGASRDSLRCASVVAPVALRGIPFAALRLDRHASFRDGCRLRYRYRSIRAVAEFLSVTGSAARYGRFGHDQCFYPFLPHQLRNTRSHARAGRGSEYALHRGIGRARRV
jgi:hypothetical protein